MTAEIIGTASVANSDGEKLSRAECEAVEHIAPPILSAILDILSGQTRSVAISSALSLSAALLGFAMHIDQRRKDDQLRQAVLTAADAIALSYQDPAGNG